MSLPPPSEWRLSANAAQLASNGVAPSGQSLGIAHYLGAGPAARVMAAPDGAAVRDFVSAAAVKEGGALAVNNAAGKRVFLLGAKPQGGLLALMPAAANQGAGRADPDRRWLPPAAV